MNGSIKTEFKASLLLSKGWHVGGRVITSVEKQIFSEEVSSGEGQSEGKMNGGTGGSK